MSTTYIKEEPLRERSRLLLVLAFFAVGMGVIAFSAIAGLSYWQFSAISTERNLEALGAATRQASTQFENSLAQATNDLRVLQRIPPVEGITRTVDRKVAAGEHSLDSWRNQLASTFRSFMQQHPEYLQIRFIGARDGGREIVRLDRSAGAINVTPTEDLQQKGERDYFRQTLALPPTRTYLSRIELNREFGEIEKPHQPVIRAAIPVYAADETPFGVLVINIDMAHVFQSMRRGLKEEERLTVADSAGNILVHPFDESKAFRHEFGDRITLSDVFDRDPGFTARGFIRGAQLPFVFSETNVTYWDLAPDRSVSIVVAAPEGSLMSAPASERDFTLLASIALLMVLLGAGMFSINVLARPYIGAEHPSSTSHIVASMLTAAGLLYVDLQIEANVLIGGMYSVIVLVLLSRRDSLSAVFAAVVSTICIVSAAASDAKGNYAEYQMLANTGLSILIVWTLTFVGIRFVGAEREANALNRSLEERVEQRTNELQTQQLRLRSLIRYAPVGICTLDGSEQIIEANPAMQTIFADVRAGDLLTVRALPAYRDELAQQIDLASAKTERPIAFRGARGDEIWCSVIVTRVQPSDAEPYKLVLIQDVTAAVSSRQEIERQLGEKDILLREIHHRVKNNLQIISSLLNLQMRQAANDDVTRALQDSQRRIETMALVHDRLYLEQKMSEIDLGDYLQELAKNTLQTMSSQSIRLVTDLASLPSSIDAAISLGLILNELVTNSQKYAFLGRESGTIYLTLYSEEEYVVFEYADDGPGFEMTLDEKASPSLGLRLIRILTTQLRGTLEWSAPNASVRIRIPTEAIYGG